MRAHGFTLSELLIALAILGIIATFTIPKVLQAQSDAKYKSIAKEAAAAVSEAYLVYKSKNAVDSGTDTRDIFAYLNYVNLVTVGEVDRRQTEATEDCSGQPPYCFRLHNGAIVYHHAEFFGGFENTNAVSFIVDPDGLPSASTTGPAKGVQFWLYYNGRLRTRGTTEPNTCRQGNCYATPSPSLDPPWFSWD